MAENKRGVFGSISLPNVYNLVQFVAGAAMYREAMVRDHIRPFDGCTIVDIGCGTGEYVEYIAKSCRDFEYYGFDGEAKYIEHAQQRYASMPNVHFFHKILTADDAAQFKGADIAMAMGVMHHMDDSVVLALLRVAKSALKPGGRLVTYDPGLYDRMSFMEWFFATFDRGRSIRTEDAYANLIGQVFPEHRSHVRYLTYYKSRNVIFECNN